MTEEETRFLLYKASAAYPNIELDEETVVVWIERLQPILFERGLANLDHHIDTNDFFPKIANIIRHDHEFVAEHERLKLATTERFALLDEWSQSTEGPPDGYWDEVRSKLAGEM